MEIDNNIQNYITLKKDKISKLTNNKVNSYFNNLNLFFDDMIFSKNFGVLDSNNKKIIMGKYEILGYYNKINKKWIWAFSNKYIEKYLSVISKKIESIISDITENKKKLKNFNYNNLSEKDLESLLNICLYYSDKIWIMSRTINLDDNLLEFIIITDLNQVN